MKNRLTIFFGSFSLIRRDPMLVLLMLAPFLAGAALYFGLPRLAPLLLSAFGFDLTPWYVLADMMLLMLAPLLAGTLCGFLMLDERDEGVGQYYGATPLGNAGYLISRLIFPVLWSIIVAPVLMIFFSLSHPDFLRVCAIALTGGLFGVSFALLLLTFAGNKVEGLAAAKITGLIMLPMLVPFFTPSRWAIIAGVFPSYWMGILMQDSLAFLPVALAVSAIWLIILYRRMSRKR